MLQFFPSLNLERVAVILNMIKSKEEGEQSAQEHLKEKFRAKAVKETTCNVEEEAHKAMREHDADFCHQDIGISHLA
eukprot:15365879-Ditylum_brightwellii.AAC.1